MGEDQLLQNANDLFLIETAALNRLTTHLENRQTSNRGVFGGMDHDPIKLNATYILLI